MRGERDGFGVKFAVGIEAPKRVEIGFDLFQVRGELPDIGSGRNSMDPAAAFGDDSIGCGPPQVVAATVMR